MTRRAHVRWLSYRALAHIGSIILGAIVAAILGVFGIAPALYIGGAVGAVALLMSVLDLYEDYIAINHRRISTGVVKSKDYFIGQMFGRGSIFGVWLWIEFDTGSGSATLVYGPISPFSKTRQGDRVTLHHTPGLRFAAVAEEAAFQVVAGDKGSN
ncbi:MAG: hypothetical protein QY326_00990 [Bdellovibrionota bacterium]|nr:MAG: hypothetical protein QY326_00990 [Bdellovibrionota bacterium]